MKLERRLARIEQAFQTFSQQLAHSNHAHGDPAGTLVATLIDSQSKQFASSADFLRVINEIGLERAAASMGRRGGRKRAATAARNSHGQYLPGRRATADCPLCADSLTANFSMAQWEEHQKHKGQGNGRREDRGRQESAETYEVQPEHIHQHNHQPEYPLPVVSLGDQTGGAGDSHPESEDVGAVQQTNGLTIS